MRSLVQLCCKGFILAVISLIPSLASAEGFKVNRLYILGDSLSDGGAYSNFSKFTLLENGAPPGLALSIDFYKFTQNSAPFANNWVDRVANKLGVTTAPDIINGINPLAFDALAMDQDTIDNKALLTTDDNVNGGNYAQGGSRVKEQNTTPDNAAVGLTAIPVVEQVDRLLADVGSQFHKNDLVAILAGANDVFNTDQAGYLQAIVDLNAQIDRLKAAGARNILVLRVPTPSVAVGGAGFEDFNIFNNALQASRAGQDGLVIDFTRFVDAAIIAPERFGYAPNGVLPGNRACVGAGTSDSLTCIKGVTENPGGPFFNSDGVHLSNLTNQHIGDIVFASIKAASQKGIILTNTMRSLRQHNLSLESRLTPSALYDEKGKRRAVGNKQAHASFEGGVLDTDSGQVDPGTETTSLSLRVGGDVVVSKNTILGVSLSFSHQDTDYEDKSGSYDSFSIVGTLYANVSLTDSFFMNAVIGGGYVDIDTNRRFTIGPSQESYDGETSGTYFIARIGGGYAFKSGGWSITPGTSYTYERLDLDGYTETFGVASLSYGDNELESSRISASLTVRYKPTDPRGWSPMFRVSVEHEFEDNDFKVRLGPDSNTIGALYLERPDDTYGYVTGGLSKKIDDNASFGISATAIVGEEGVTGVTGGVSFKAKF